MTTIAVAKKNGHVAIAADSLTTFDDLRLPRHHMRGHDKLLHVHDAYIGICGSSAHHLVLESALAKLDDVKLGSRNEVYETFRRLHPVLKEHAFLNPKEDEEDPYESSQITALIVNDSGAYGLFSLREVFDYERFWAVGSGSRFALGAMHALWDKFESAADLAKAGVAAGIEFDTGSAAPISCHTVQLAKGVQ